MSTLSFRQIRDLFFEENEQFKNERRTRKSHNNYSTDCRCAFCDYVDYLQKDGVITENQANKITLG